MGGGGGAGPSVTRYEVFEWTTECPARFLEAVNANGSIGPTLIHIIAEFANNKTYFEFDAALTAEELVLFGIMRHGVGSPAVGAWACPTPGTGMAPDNHEIDDASVGNLILWTSDKTQTELDLKANKSIVLTAGEGLSGGGDLSANRTFELNVDELTATSMIDNDADYLVMYDASATNHKKILIDDIPFGGASFKQIVCGEVGRYAGSTKIKWDSSTPQHWEGTQIWSQKFTPTSGTNHVIVKTCQTLSYSSESGNHIVVAIFRDNTCVGSGVYQQPMAGYDDDDDTGTFTVVIRDIPGTANEVTYSVRVGKGERYGCWYVNRTKDSSNKLGGTLGKSAYTIIEVAM